MASCKLMNSSKPYLARALYEWILDNDSTPDILGDASVDQVMIPQAIVGDEGKVVLNLAPQAIQEFEMTNDYISFSARFSGVSERVHCPMTALLAIYARENGEGMMFPAEDKPSPGDAKKAPGPSLKIIK